VSTLTRIVCTFDGGAASAGSGSNVERDLARLQRALQDLVDEGSGGDLRLGLGFRRTRRGGERLEAADEVGIGAVGLGRAALELGEDQLDAVDRRQDEGDGLARHRHAVPELAHQRLGRMRQRLEARQAEKAAGALDGVDEPEDVAQDRLVAGLALEADELHVDNVEMLAGFGQKLAQQSSISTRTQRTQRKRLARRVSPGWVYDRLRSPVVKLPVTVIQAAGAALIVTSSPSIEKVTGIPAACAMRPV